MRKIFNNSQMDLDIPYNPKYLICCDVDETYLPHKKNMIKNSGIKQFEKFFLKKYKVNGYILCWITGSSISKFKNKVKYLKVKPHAIASDLGSEIFTHKNGSLIKEKKWYENKNKKLFFKNYKKIYLETRKYYLIKKESFGALRKSFYVY